MNVVEIVIRGQDQASGALSSVEGHLASLEKNSTGATSAWAGLGRSLTALAGIAVAFEGFRALAGGIDSVLTSGAKFQTLMNTIQNNTTMTNADVKAMHDGILALGAETGQSFEGLANGFMHITNLTGDTSTAMG